MKTSGNWAKFINVVQLKHALTSTEMATVIGFAAEQVLDWHDYKGRLVVRISGRGGRFVSYWQLSRAVDWLVQAIANCWDTATWLQLQKWIQAAWKRFKYSPEAKQQVEQALQQQQARLEERPKAEEKANLFVKIISDCQDHKSLDLAAQLFCRQRSQLEKYPDLIEHITSAGKQQRAYLCSLEVPTQQNSPEYWNNKGLALLEAKKYSEAIAAYNMALQLQPDFAQAWNNLGCALDRIKQYKEAMRCFEQAIQLQPEFKTAIQNRELLLTQPHLTDST